MRISSALVTVALALFPLSARAQTPAAPAAPAPSAGSWTGSFDFGVRGTSVDGDAARYERYRDLSDGLFLETVRLNRARNGWILAVNADHVAGEDQRYTATAERTGTFKSWFMWDQIPMLLSRTTQTLYSGIGTGELRIDNALQARVQLQPSAINAVFDQNAVVFETSTKRKIAEGGFEYQPNGNVTLNGIFRYTRREGTIPYGGSFGHSSLVELPAPTNHSTTAADAGIEFVRDRVLLRAAYTGSWFQNDVTTVIFDNPYRATDISATPSAGRLSLAPTNSFMGVNGLASFRLPFRSRVTAYVSGGTLRDNAEPIMPQTINTANLAAITPLDRTTVDGEARTTALRLNFVSRPTRNLDITAGFRQYDYDNRTPEFAMTQRVSYDNTPSNVVPAVHTEPFSVLRHTFDADFKVLGAGVSAGVGYTNLGEDRTHRIFESNTDNVLRLVFDAVGSRQYAVRTKYEHAQRRGTGIEEGERELALIGEQPGMRHFDVAERDRDRVTVLTSFTARSNLGVNLSAAFGKDDFLDSEFGLRDNKHQVYAVGFDATPNDRVILATSYSYEQYNALSRSRQANPGVQFFDPRRNWATDATDRAHTVILSAEVQRIADKVNLRVSYDFSHATADYDYITGAVEDRTLPDEVIVPTTLPPPEQLPPTLSDLRRGTVDLTYALATRLSIGFSYWYEKYDVEDFTLDVEANPELVRGQAVLMGYLYTPYTANTVWGRLIYHW